MKRIDRWQAHLHLQFNSSSLARSFAGVVTTVTILLAVGPVAAAEAGFGFQNVVARAQKLAERPYQEPAGSVPDWLLGISYDEWRDIRFRPEHALWRDRGLPFEVQFFHPGLYYDRAIRIHVVDADGAHPVQFSPSQFDYGKNKFGSQVPQTLGYAGFRLHYPINKPDYKDEVIVFLGASYFRAVGKGQAFGLSARALAVDTALPSGEEFPYFTQFWLVRPTRKARAIRIFALLDSRRVTGAYEFVVTPGAETLVDVKEHLFVREEIEKIGIAPLTSMYYFGENTMIPPLDYRPEVHDSDGLLLAAAGGEWIWRPLMNPRRLNVSGHQLGAPRGFGLVQRDRDFGNYQDLETRPELRPSVWISPEGDWGKGRVELVEIPTQADIHDNIVTFWVPDEPLRPGQSRAFAYRMHWFSDHPERPPGGRVVATRRDGGTFEDAHRFVIDYSGDRLTALPADTVLRGVITVGSAAEPEGELLEQQVVKNPVDGGWRLTFQVRPATSEPLELRAFVQKGEEALTETWSYVILP